MMNEGKSAMTYSSTAFASDFMDARRITGVPGIAVRVGRTLEIWGRKASQPLDRGAQRRAFELQAGNEARMLQAERLYRRSR
jgi:hypothetical protein